MLPVQKLSYTKKTQAWREQCVDALQQLCSNTNARFRADAYRKQINYDLFNGKFNRADLEYVVNPYSSTESSQTFPAQLQHYDIISPDLLLLMGEEAKRPFNFRVVTEGQDSLNETVRVKTKLLQQYIESKLFDQGTQQPMDPDQIEKYIRYNYRDVKEQGAQYLLDYLVRKLKLENKFNEGWKDVLTVGEEVYYIGEAGGEPFVELCNNIDLHMLIDDNSTDISEASAISYTRNMSLNQIVDMFGEDLKDSDLKKLQDMVASNGISGVGSNTGSTVNYIPTYVNFNADKDGNITGAANTTYNSSSVSNGVTIPVLRCEWKSLKKVGVLSYVDEKGEVQETMVPEQYKPVEGETVEWFWISEWWEGVKIGDDVYGPIRPKRIQRRNMDNISICRPGFVGRIYNARNSQSVSLIDRMKPYQYLYNIIYYRLELAMAKSIGKVAVIDITQIPKGADWNIDKWLYYIQSMGISFINPLQKPEGGGDPSHFNQYTVLDLEMGSFIDRQVMLLDKIEDRVSQLSGVSRQRRGQITQEDGLGTSERAVTQSSHITEYWFKNHGDVKREVLEALLDVSKLLAVGSKSIQYVTDDMSKVFFELDAEDFANADYGLFVSNSTKDERLLESLRQLSQVALQYDKATLSDIVSIMESNSIVEIKRKLESAEEAAFQRQMEQAKAGDQAQQQAMQAQLQDKEKDRQLKKYEIDENNKTKIEVETLRTYINTEETDKDGNGVSDPIELRKLALEERKIAAQQAAEQLGFASSERDRMHESIENEKDRKIEREKMQSQEKIAKMKPKPKPSPKKK